MRPATRSDSAVELGQWLVRELLETPATEAVREALAEERATDEEPAARSHPDDGGDGTGGVPVAALVAGLAVVGVVAYLLRKPGDDTDYPTRPNDVDEATAASDRVEAETPVETDGSTEETAR
jgi:hypothetical protein